MQLERDGDGNLRCRGITALHADTLMHIPEWLESEDERVRGRLFPRVYQDEDEEEQWRRLAVPELEHLFVSRARIVGKDLKSLAQDGAVTFSLLIPEAHTTAWVSSLNAARLALFELHDLKEEDMERELDDIADFEKELALVRIHVMAFMQELLLEAGTV